MTQLRQRFIHDLQIRNYAVSTIDTYTYHVANFAEYFWRSPEVLGPEEVRAWQVYLVTEKKVSWSAWFDQLASALLPVPHFQLVFTLPHELSSLILANRRELYDLLFRDAWETLRDVALDPRQRGAEVGAVLVLHTWGQALDHHPHVHAIVLGGGLSLDGRRWIASRSPRFFLPVQVLSQVFRGKFLAGLRRLRAAGELRELPGTGAEVDEFAALLDQLSAREWVVFCAAPPPSLAPDDPAPLVKYLARYVSGAAISDGRLLEYRDGRVTFRAKNYRQGGRRTTLSLSGLEFTRGFAQHILPRGRARVRRYGLLAPRSHATAQARALMPRPADAARREPPRCPRCRMGQFVLVEVMFRPSRQTLPADSGGAAPAQPPRPDTS